MSAPAPNHLSPTPPTEYQLRRAAELKAEGNSWPAIGRDLNVDPVTAERWRMDHPTDWRMAHARARQFVLGDVLGEALLTLRKNMRCGDPKVEVAAADSVVRYWGVGYRHRPRTQKAKDLDAANDFLEVVSDAQFALLERMVASRPEPLPPLGEHDDENDPPFDGGAGDPPSGGDNSGGPAPAAGGGESRVDAGRESGRSDRVLPDRLAGESAGAGANAGCYTLAQGRSAVPPAGGEAAGGVGTRGGAMWRVALICFAVAATTGHAVRADEPDATALAARIDRHVDDRLKVERVRPADPADDAEFLRRVYLDLRGVIPTAEQAAAFLADTDPKRREKLIDTLLAAPRYGEHLADVWQGYLISPLADDRRVRADRFRAWLAGRFNTQSWDAIATELLTATGKMEDNPAVIYLIEGRLPRTVPDLTDLTTRYFLGVRLSCAQCHDHPFVKWKQEEFWGVAAFFTQVQTPGRAKQVYQTGIKDDPALTLATLKDATPDGFLPRPPAFLGGEKFTAGKGTTNRAGFAAWLTDPKNPYFAKAMVNRTWWRLFGRGLVTPVDDMHAANPPSHPELLDLLADQFTRSGYDLKFLTRSIVHSRAYQRTSRPGDAAEKQAALFGRVSVKPFTAGQLYDSLVTVLGPASKAPGTDPRLDARSEFTQFFGDDGAPDPTAYRRGIPHLLRQMNSKQFAGRSLDALVTRVAKADRPADDVAADLYLTFLARRPTADELKVVRGHVANADTPAVAYRELAWALMMTSEFSLNH